MSQVTNIIALSDVHLRSTNPMARKDNLVKTQFKKLKFVFDYAEKHNCVILQAGDFLDKSRDWVLLVKLIEFFGKYPDVQFYCVLGQHDTYFYSTTKGTTLGVLNHMNLINILDHKVLFGVDAWTIFGSSWGKPLPRPAHPTDNILVTHRSICNSEVYPGQEYTEPQKFLEDNKKYKLIIVGDIHRSFYYKKDNRVIVNTGPMLRAEANDYNIRDHEPHFWHFQIGSPYSKLNAGAVQGKRINIPCKPSDEVLSRSHIEARPQGIDVDDITSLLGQAIDTSGNKIIFDTLFDNKEIRPKIRRHLQDIYDNAKG